MYEFNSNSVEVEKDDFKGKFARTNAYFSLSMRV